MLGEARRCSICNWAGLCSRADRLTQSCWDERSTRGRGKMEKGKLKNHPWNHDIFWYKLSLGTIFTIAHLLPPNPTYLIYEVSLKLIITALSISILGMITINLEALGVNYLFQYPLCSRRKISRWKEMAVTLTHKFPLDPFLFFFFFHLNQISYHLSQTWEYSAIPLKKMKQWVCIFHFP